MKSPRQKPLVIWSIPLFLYCGFAFSQQPTSPVSSLASLELSTVDISPNRFISTHGRRALVAGYADSGLEIWGYPFEILDDYRVSFLPSGRTTPISGRQILRRVVYHPDSVTRIYLGPGFIARETIFVPLDRPAAILTYSVQSETPVDIIIHATPVLNLMWPGGLGGQSAAWHNDLPAYVLSEPEFGFSAIVGSPQASAHDEPNNSTAPTSAEAGIGLTLHPVAGMAKLFAVLTDAHSAVPELSYRNLTRDAEKLKTEYAQHLAEYEQSVPHLRTPDERLNQAFAWSQLALDQAWVCDTGLGCGYVAGYGPSRGQRRPQYDWFFAGDGLVAADAAISAGAPRSARDEFEFILRYQDARNGMIWHELSQSATLIDWAKYPYMFAHADITFQFLGELGRYVDAPGDVDFVRNHWQAIEAAYRYCKSLIDPETGLPVIPEGKEGGNEQDRMSDDLALSVSWLEASSAFARMAKLEGRADPADEASHSAQAARVSIPPHYWDDAQSFWINGHTVAGKPMSQRRSGPAGAIDLFDRPKQDILLDQLASADFETDWGARSVASGSAAYDPHSYAKGSVWPVATAYLADAFWSNHRPLTALSLWQSLVRPAWLDSLGHFPEVLDGNNYQPQQESVPEQTWSSAGFLIATVRGLMGIDFDSSGKMLTFAPRIPEDWPGISLTNLSLFGKPLSLTMHRSQASLSLEFDNAGPPFQLEFRPDLPLGATLRKASLNGRPLTTNLKQYPQQTEGELSTTVPSGKSDLRIEWQGGVAIILENPDPVLGEASAGLRIVDLHLDGRRLTIDADVREDRESHLRLVSPWTVEGATGVVLQARDHEQIELTFPPISSASSPYHRVHAEIEFKP